MEYLYKALTVTDIELFKELLEVFGQAFGEPETYTGAMPSQHYLQSLLHKSHFIALAALAEAEVVGGLVAYELEKFEQERSEIYIYDLAVHEAHRRKGIATGLIKKLKDIAKDRGAYVIFVQADQGDTPAIKLYESLGTREDVHHFDVQVGTDKV